MVERLVADMVSTDISRMSQTQQKIFADFENTGKFAIPAVAERWSHFLRQPAKVDSPMQRTIHHEDAETVFG